MRRRTAERDAADGAVGGGDDHGGQVHRDTAVSMKRQLHGNTLGQGHRQGHRHEGPLCG